MARHVSPQRASARAGHFRPHRAIISRCHVRTRLLPTERAAEHTDFKSWLADALAALQREHNTNPAIIPVRIWRHLYIQGRAPQEAAAQAAVSAYNARPAADRLRDRKR
jgi:hypothetical protein